MAAQVPAALKSADITRFAHRAAQLESVKPVVAYWCEYWIVNQILSKGLHSADQECLTYTTTLMDKLEQVRWPQGSAQGSRSSQSVTQFKAENQSNDAVVDDVAGKAYVEQFGLETFQRADNAVRANKASRQTADTFQASATFLDLLQIWGPIEAEVVGKIKYAKYHALRIAKAIKAGEDPNLSNPKIEPEPEEILPKLDPNDPDVQMLNGGQGKPRQASVVEVPDDGDRAQRHLAQRSHLDESLHPSRDPSIPRAGDPASPRQPSIEHVPDEAHHLQSKLARQSSMDESLHPSRAPSAPPPDVSPLIHPSNPTGGNDITSISPISPETNNSITAERKLSIGGNYFPSVPPPLSQANLSTMSDTDPLELPSAPADYTLPQQPTSFPPPHHAHSMPPEHPTSRPSPPPPTRHHGHFLPATQPIPPSLAPQSAPRPPVPQAPPQIHGAAVIAPSARELEINEEAIMKAQKHARWAISALNFEDVPTAVRELRGALETLGGL